MEPLVLVLMLILLQTLYFGIEVGRARQRLGIEAPAVSGDDEFDRYFRSYVKEPKKSTLGFVLSFFSSVILIMTSLVSSLLILF